MRFMWPVLVSLGLLGGCTSVHPLQQAMPGVTPHSAEEGKSLLDKQAIYEVLSRYCRGVDRLDEELVRYPEPFARLKSDYHAWDASMAPIPADARFPRELFHRLEALEAGR